MTELPKDVCDQGPKKEGNGSGDGGEEEQGGGEGGDGEAGDGGELNYRVQVPPL